MGTQGTETTPKAGVTAAGPDTEKKLLNTGDVLRAEANAIHNVDIDTDANGDPGRLYRDLHGLNSTALCLSGGGIRSASFALGVIEALAVYPRQTGAAEEGKKAAASAEQSFLSQFHYLSTVSGGGYIGSWLSAWIARAGYANVWPKLIGRRDEHPEKEPSEINWLRAYSNYLTPRLGLFSADTWTAAALVVRNLILNWLIIVPALCLLLLIVKATTVAAFWVTGSSRWVTIVFALVGGVLMIWTLRFALLNRPSQSPCSDPGPATPTTASDAAGAGRRDDQPNYHGDRLQNESATARAGAGEAAFLVSCLLPSVVAAAWLSMYLMNRGAFLATKSLSYTLVLSMLIGMAIYTVAWIVAAPPLTWKPCTDEKDGQVRRDALYWFRDFAAWLAAGGVYGAIVGLSVYLVAKFKLWFLIGNLAGQNTTGYFLIAFIYGVPWIITAQLTAEMIFVGLTAWQRHSDPDREWFGRSTGWFAVAAFVWFAVSFLVLIAGDFLLDLLMKYDSAKIGSTLLAVGSGLFSIMGGKSSKSSASAQDDSKSSLLMRIALPLAAIIFLILLVLAVSLSIDYLLFEKSLLDSSLLHKQAAVERRVELTWLVIGFLVVTFVAAIAWTHVNINRFSIHSLYRNRLIRGYLGASNPKRAPNPFTGFDEADNIRMQDLWPPQPGRWQPFHVVNIALNVVNSKRLAWQERKAEPFTMTPLHCGTATDGLGYRRSEEYAGGITLGTALAISGAAASPNMGYNSSPLVTLMLALFNVRLGWWLGNPGPKGEPSYHRDGPRVAIKPFIGEMFGLTSDDRQYVYLSDGGHFENLGLYEMIRRRCRCIVISDAGCDPNYAFEDLGNAVRKIAIDLGVYVTFGQLRKIVRRSRDNAVIEGAYYAIGEIDYKAAPENQTTPSSPESREAEAKRLAAVANGYILYVKPSYHGSESAGIVAYATANAAFPHETTGDQFFSESQFESYRSLGFEIVSSVLRNASENVETINRAEERPKPEKPLLSAHKLEDLVAALHPETISRAEDVMRSVMRQPPPTIPGG